MDIVRVLFLLSGLIILYDFYENSSKSQPSPTRFDITSSTPRYCNRTCRQASYRIAATVQGRTLYVAKANITSLSRGVERERPRCRTSARGALTARCRLPSACFGRLHRVWPSLSLSFFFGYLGLFCSVPFCCRACVSCCLLPSSSILLCCPPVGKGSS